MLSLSLGELKALLLLALAFLSRGLGSESFAFGAKSGSSSGETPRLDDKFRSIRHCQVAGPRSELDALCRLTESFVILGQADRGRGLGEIGAARVTTKVTKQD